MGTASCLSIGLHCNHGEELRLRPDKSKKICEIFENLISLPEVGFLWNLASEVGGDQISRNDFSRRVHNKKTTQLYAGNIIVL